MKRDRAKSFTNIILGSLPIYLFYLFNALQVQDISSPLSVKLAQIACAQLFTLVKMWTRYDIKLYYSFSYLRQENSIIISLLSYYDVTIQNVTFRVTSGGGLDVKRLYFSFEILIQEK